MLGPTASEKGDGVTTDLGDVYDTTSTICSTGTRSKRLAVEPQNDAGPRLRRAV